VGLISILKAIERWTGRYRLFDWAFPALTKWIVGGIVAVIAAVLAAVQQIPWFVIPLAAMGGLGITGWALRQFGAPETTTAHVRSPHYVAAQAITARGREAGKPNTVSYGATLQQDIARLRVFVDFQWNLEDNWSDRRRVPIEEFKDYTSGQRIVFKVIDTEETERGIILRKWGSAPLFNGDEATIAFRRFPQGDLCVARLALKGDDGDEQHYYFMLAVGRSDDDIVVINEAAVKSVFDWALEP